MKRIFCLLFVLLLLSACAPRAEDVPPAIWYPQENAAEEAPASLPEHTDDIMCSYCFRGRFAFYKSYYRYFFPESGEPQAVRELSKTYNAGHDRFVRQIVNGELPLLVPCYDGEPLRLDNRIIEGRRNLSGRIFLYAPCTFPFFEIFFHVRLEEAGQTDQDPVIFAVRLRRYQIENLEELENYPYTFAANRINECGTQYLKTSGHAGDRVLTIFDKTVFANRDTGEAGGIKEAYYRFLYRGYEVQVYGRESTVTEELMKHFSLGPITQTAMEDFT